jgi:HD-like signal output (HDOD) protein
MAGEVAVGTARGLELPALPALHGRLTQVLEDPHATATQIADLLRQDAALTAKLLRLCNSAFYGFPYRIETVSRAVLIVGTRQLADLALATLVTRVFRGVPPDLADMEAFWQHAVGTAVAARVLATLRRETNVERFFVAGILHDVGRLLLYTQRADQAREILREARRTGAPLIELERAALGWDHATLGGDLLAAWGLPPSLVEPVAFHHAPGRAPAHPTEAAVVHVADALAHALELGSSGEHGVPALDPAAWTRVGLDPQALRDVLDQMDRQFEEAVHLVRHA